MNRTIRIGSLVVLLAATAALQATHAWTLSGSMNIARWNGALAFVLPDGKLLVVGGSATGDSTTDRTTELYDPATGIWSAGPPTLRPSRAARGHPAGGRAHPRVRRTLRQ